MAEETKAPGAAESSAPSEGQSQGHRPGPLAQFVAESGKIVPRRLTGVCTPHQRRLSTAIKQARNIALLPFAGRAM